ncbi:RIP metalloprotease RseP [Murdochiella vaginalis]|uniref:RIP metalloprotease RseP n=1 Tax=Murdochiella vaginalis TaxID=1852373 RepID=UPI0008FDE2B3|nr:RIP metalloprotease RseP [Murdochiella vaginalis]
MTIILALLVFLIVIVFHELGHFSVAKWVGIRVLEFSVGMGPALWQKAKGETTYSLRALPLGGYCAMEGEDEASDDEASFTNAKPGQRFLTILAGPMMNLVIAYICFVLFLGVQGVAVPVVQDFSVNSPAAEAGMQGGDRITAIDGENVTSGKQLVDLLQRHTDLTRPVQVTVLRDNTSKTIAVQPDIEQGKVLLGITMQRKSDFLGAFGAAWSMLWDTLFSLFTILQRLFTGALSINALSGPIGVVSMIGQAAQKGFSQLLFFTGYISLNLAFFNLLPIPALDGFTLWLIALEKLRGKPLSMKVENGIKVAGFALLIGLILFVSFKDILRLI